jgi:hypothetical protein
VLKKVLGQVIELKQVATSPLTATWEVNNDYSKVMNFSNSINVDNLVTAESVARAITRLLKL